MSLRTIRILLTAALAVAALTSALAVAAAAPERPAATASSSSTSASSIAVEVALTETVKGQDPDAFRATLSVAGDRGCASVAADQGAVGYELKLCRDGGTDAAPVLSFEVTRTTRGKELQTSRFRMSSRLATGKRAVVGALAIGGRTSELAAEVQ